ncbi:MAG: Fe-S cluster assembly ATPase SufC [archaeon]|jgi:Fe-S cluster assembly ATP-binding protein|nr:Fe-S cluster assembly ATPase SufC [archaeon]MDD2477917.1 Fe-S cluster assembly ATPase SufC [Candidatus ainarchaeum sp.]MDD3084456.1 Fe-S cluster assembly ATPase SufC [Candidatus ainarchaeum sp.]MDD4220918.1 Fe-S cluster assembly ATPase SufC [Candidatus ainarchaeum sp.]MDD4662902.1 Fe-S cluster assembly ATPase SufC [Candidatus ainarchaeum sp.]
MKKLLLSINNLSVNVEHKKILSKFKLDIKEQEVHAIMGPNGSGKSTLAYTIMGHPKYQVTSGKIIFKNKNILNLSADKRAKLGLFLSFQTPLEIPGLNYFSFLRNSYISTYNKKISVLEFNLLVKKQTKLLHIDDSFLSRALNVGFSGGEKKRAEILQLNLLNPSLAILDETDSGLDVDSLKLVCKSINNLKKENPNFSVIVITHHKKILDFLKPDFVHVMNEGEIIKSGDKSFANNIEKNGFTKIIDEYKKLKPK